MKTNNVTGKISVRKLVLLILIAVLVVFFVCQLVISGANDAYRLTLKNGVDSIIIKNGINPEIHLVNTNGTWMISESPSEDDSKMSEAQIFPANADAVKIMEDFLAKIDVISVVSRSSDDERFGFGETSSIFVTAEKKGKVVRIIEIGKNSVSTQQVYCRLDKSKDVVLVGGNPKNVFSLDFNQLKGSTEKTAE